jgi:hypothetical protein
VTSNDKKNDGDELPLPQGCKRVSACLDYRAYVFALPQASDPHAHAGLVAALCALGRREPPRLGVRYVYAVWGFLVVPPAGFPELRINFFRHAKRDRIAGVLQRISALIERFVAT